jgi:hypothetical protein
MNVRRHFTHARHQTQSIKSMLTDLRMDMLTEANTIGGVADCDRGPPLTPSDRRHIAKLTSSFADEAGHASHRHRA